MTERQAPPTTPEELRETAPAEQQVGLAGEGPMRTRELSVQGRIGSVQYGHVANPAAVHAYGQRCFDAGKAAALEGPVWVDCPGENGSLCIVNGSLFGSVEQRGEHEWAAWRRSSALGLGVFPTEPEARAAVEEAVRGT